MGFVVASHLDFRKFFSCGYGNPGRGIWAAARLPRSIFIGRNGLSTMLKISVSSLFGLGGLLLLTVSAWAQESGEARGKLILEKQCAQCHSIGVDDVSKHPDSPPFRELSKRYPIEHLAEALAEGIMTGHPDMPIFEFQAEQISDILAYLHSIQID